MAKRATRRLKRYYSLNLDLHIDATNFAPNEFREVVNLSGFAVYKGSNTRGNNNNGATERKVKTVKVNGVNYGGNMDRGPITFNGDISLPKDDKELCWVNKL